MTTEDQPLVEPSWLTKPHIARHPFDNTGVQIHALATGLTPHTHLIPDDQSPEVKQAMATHIDRWHRP